jgi:acyl carrier protein
MLDKVKKIISEQLDVELEKITLDTRLMDDLKADSMDLVEMVMAFEEEFNISIPDEDAEKMVKVSDVIDYLEKKVG